MPKKREYPIHLNYKIPVINRNISEQFNIVFISVPERFHQNLSFSFFITVMWKNVVPKMELWLFKLMSANS